MASTSSPKPGLTLADFFHDYDDLSDDSNDSESELPSTEEEAR